MSPITRVDRRLERRRRRHRRLYPLLAVAVVLVALAAWWVTRGSTAPAPPAKAVAATSTTAKVVPAYLPPAVAGPITPAEPGEGQWAPVDNWSPGPPAILTTTFRPDPARPDVVAYAAWIRTGATQLALYPGYKGPGSTTLDRGPEMVPQAAWPDLLATFNSGFYEEDSAGGFYVHGTLYFPMVDGLATVVAYADGSVDVVDWHGGATPGPGVVMARQNLPMLVDGGHPTATASVPADWGVTLGGVPDVWRTGLGVDAHGNLLYVAAPDQSAASLARILVAVGAVRAMQLDINPEWPIFVTYAGAGATAPTLFVPNPNQIPNRFLYPSTKDFFAVYQRLPGVVAQPW
jgi:hypothetical protein